MNPQAAWQVDSRVLLRLLPHLDQDLLHDVRQQIAQALASGRYQTWQEALNGVSGATSHRAGLLSFHARVKCRDCNGKRIDLRRGRVCYRCMGRGSTTELVRITVLRAPVPQPE